MTEPRLHVVLYAAKSTEDTGESIPGQLQELHQIAEREGWIIEGEYTDENFSGFSGNRGPGLARAKTRAAEVAKEHGRATIAVTNSDRLARGAGDAPGAADSLDEIFHQAARQNVDIWTAQSGRTLDPLYAAIEAVRNHMDSAAKSTHVKRGKQRRAEKGGSTGPVNFGQRRQQKLDANGDPVMNGDRIVYDRVRDPDEVAALIEMFERRAQGEGIGEITRWANRAGYVTRRGQHFGRNAIREILRNPIYIGLNRHNGELFQADPYDPIIDREVWDAVQAIDARTDAVGQRSRKGGRPSDVALLSGLMTCTRCGRGVWHTKQARVDGSIKRRLYVCSSVRHATGVCDLPYLDAELVERAVLVHFDGLFVDFEQFLTDILAERAKRGEELDAEVGRLLVQQTSLEKDRKLFRADYTKSLREGQESRGRLAAEMLEESERDLVALTSKIADVEAQRADWDAQFSSDAALDWWNELTAGIHQNVGGAASTRQANTALKNLLSAVDVSVDDRGTARLHFVLRHAHPEGFTEASINVLANGSRRPIPLAQVLPVESARFTFV